MKSGLQYPIFPSIADKKRTMYPPPANSVLYLTGYPPMSSTIYDKSGNANNGTITEATWTRLPSGLWALSFDGTDDNVLIAASNSLSPTDGAGTDSAISLGAWINMTDATTFPIILRGKITTREYALYTDGADKLSWLFTDPTYTKGIYTLSNAALTAYEGKWIQVWATYDGSEAKEGLLVYVNGAPLAATQTAYAVYAGITRSADGLAIGRMYEAGISYATGKMGLWREIMGTALSAAKILDSFNQERHLFGV